MPVEAALPTLVAALAGFAWRRDTVLSVFLAAVASGAMLQLMLLNLLSICFT